MLKRNGKILNCKACEKSFYVPEYRINTAKFCSLDCQNHKQYKRYIFECKNCGKKCEASLSKANYKKKFCSKDCHYANGQTEKERRNASRLCSNRKRGFSSNRQLRRWIWDFKEKKCKICGYDEYDFCLDIHHLDKNPQNNDEKNLIVLCAICHRKHHKGIIDAAA